MVHRRTRLPEHLEAVAIVVTMVMLTRVVDEMIMNERRTKRTRRKRRRRVRRKRRRRKRRKTGTIRKNIEDEIERRRGETVIVLRAHPRLAHRHLTRSIRILSSTFTARGAEDDSHHHLMEVDVEVTLDQQLIGNEKI